MDLDVGIGSKRGRTFSDLVVGIDSEQGRPLSDFVVGIGSKRGPRLWFLVAGIAAALTLCGCPSRPAAGQDAGTDAGQSGGPDAGTDAGFDAGARGALCRRVDGGPGIDQLTTGGAFACIRQGGSVRCWGANDVGELGDGLAAHQTCANGECSSAPVTVSGLVDAIQVSAGVNSACAVRGTGNVVCWGINLQGQLGDGLSSHTNCSGGFDCSRTPVQVVNLNNAIQVAVGNEHACALKADGSVVCWGGNDHGQLGNATVGTEQCSVPGISPPLVYPCLHVPTAVAGISGALSIGAGYDQTCAVLPSGAVTCWGNGEFGALGDGNFSADSDGGVTVQGISDAVQIAPAYERTCVRRSGGAVACWGWNDEGGLGDGTVTHQLCATVDCSPTEVAVINLTDAEELAGIWTHSCVRRSDGTAACWGDSRSGEIGDGAASDTCPSGIACREEPTPVTGLSNVTALAGGAHFGCFLTSDCTVHCTGENYSGELGNGDLTTATVNVPVPATLVQ